MRAFWIVVACLMLSPSGVKAGDIWACEVDGRVWFVNRKPPRAQKCKLVVKGEKPRHIPTATKAKKYSSPSRKKKKPKDKRLANWRPQHAMYFNKRKATADEKLKDIDLIIKKASATYNIPEAFIRGVIEVESSYKVKALSHKGAMGLMQLMPGTAKDMGVTNPWDPYQNVMGGTKFLRYLANRFNGDIPKVIAAYHAGGGSVRKAGGIPFVGSDGYVRKVLTRYYRNRDASRESSK